MGEAKRRKQQDDRFGLPSLEAVRLSDQILSGDSVLIIENFWRKKQPDCKVITMQEAIKDNCRKSAIEIANSETILSLGLRRQIERGQGMIHLVTLSPSTACAV